MTIIAVDFDGTLCENAWPEIGPPKYDVLDKLLYLKDSGDKLILWTCRTGTQLQEAIEWCREFGLEFDAVNENLPEIVAQWKDDVGPKVFANIYLDDLAVNVKHFCN